MKLATKLIRHYPTHLRHVATLPWEANKSNFLQVFSSCGRKCKQIAFVQRFLTNMNSCSRSLYAVARPSVVCL